MPEILRRFHFSGGQIGNRLRYAAVVVNTSLTGATLKYKQGNEVYQNWENFVSEQVYKFGIECNAN